MPTLPIQLLSVVSLIGLIFHDSSALFAQTSAAMVTDSTYTSPMISLGYDSIKAQTISGSIVSLVSRDFNQGIISSPFMAIQGRLPGLFISPVHGNPNGKVTTILRGRNSLFDSNEPLYVVDGVPEVSIENIAIEDIEQITLIKEASQAGVYGGRAGNGVLLITTKRGTKGYPHVAYNGYVGISYTAARPNILTADEYRAAVRKFGLENTFQDQGAHTDWYRSVTRSAITHNHQLAVDGGIGKTTYRLSGGYLSHQGVVNKSDLQRLNARLNAGSQLFREKLHLNAFLSAISTTRHDLPENLFLQVLQALPTNPVYNQDGSYFVAPQSNFSNPVAQLAGTTNESRQQEWLGNFRTQYFILNGLSVGVSYALRNVTQERDRISFSTAGSTATTYYVASLSNRWLELSAQYKKQWQQHMIGVQLNYLNQFTQTKDVLSEKAGTGFTDFTRSSSSTYLISYSGQFSYNLAKQWLAHINLVRNESFSLTGDKDNIWLPSASVAWAISEGKLWGNNPLLNQLKWRVNWGKSSTSGTPFRRYTLLPNTIKLDIFWPVVESYGTGIDFSIFKNRLSGSLDWYTKNSRNKNFTPLPNVAGGRFGTSQYAIRNRGVELSLRAPILQKPTAQWDVTFIGAANRSKIVESNFTQLPMFSLNGNTLVIARKNESAGSLSGFLFDEIVNGLPTYQDADQDGNSDVALLGNIDPFFTTSLTNTVTVKRLDIGFTFIGVFGNKTYRMDRSLLAVSGFLLRYNISPEALHFSQQAYPYASSLFVENASFVRLDNFSIGYTFARHGKRFRQARVYLAGRNVFILTSYQGVDPQEGELGVSTFENFYPASRSFNLGVNLKL